MSENEDISKSLNLEPIPRDTTNTEIVEESFYDEDVDDKSDEDLEFARKNYYNVIEKGSEALDQILELSRASEHPRGYEVSATLMKTIMDANRGLADLSDKREKLNKDKKDSSNDSTKSVTNNNLFVGSTSDLQQALKDMKENNDK